MHGDIISGMESTMTTFLQRVDISGRWDNYESREDNITVSAGDFTITELHAGYSYSRLKSIFQVVNFLKVKRYLDRNNLLYSFLYEVEAGIRKYFPKENLRLELYEDPEGEMEDELAIYILTHDKPHVALNKLNKFDCECRTKKMDQYENLVTINIEYL